MRRVKPVILGFLCVLAGILPVSAHFTALNKIISRVDAFSRIASGTNTAIHRTASGKVNGSATLRGYLNGQPVDVRYDPNSASPWKADLSLLPGNNTLTVYADHPSGLFTTNTSSTFTVNAGSSDRETSQYDGAGNVTNRVWKNAAGLVVKSQTLTWNAFGQLVKFTDRDANNSGANFTATFDALGRQLQTIETAVSNNVVLSTNPSPLVITYAYDPAVRFQLIGIGLSQGASTRQDWLSYGPDLSGSYGGMQGVGGLETITTSDNKGLTLGVLSDSFGNVLGGITNGVIDWNASRVNMYGPVEGFTPPRLELNVATYRSLAWRTRPIFAPGMVQLGLRTYDYTRRAFLSADSLGHDSDPALNTAFGGRPSVYFDPSGMCIESFANSTVGNMIHNAMDDFTYMMDPYSNPDRLDADTQQMRYDYDNGGYENVINRYSPVRQAIEAASGLQTMPGPDQGRELSGWEQATAWANTVSFAASLGAGAPGTMDSVSADLGSLRSSLNDILPSRLNPGNYSFDPSQMNSGVPMPDYTAPVVRNENGGVDFANSSDLYPAGAGQKNTVKINYTGSRRQDFGAANEAAGTGTTQKPPDDYTWHHLDDYDPESNTGTMQLVGRDAHEATYPHSGGVSQYEKSTGKKYK